MKIKDYDLLPCPFCNSNEDMEITTLEINPKKEVNKAGVRRKQIQLRQVVKCYSCGVQGPTASPKLDCDAELLTQANIDECEGLVVLLWNTRTPINQKAFELVNQLIVSTINSIKE